MLRRRLAFSLLIAVSAALIPGSGEATPLVTYKCNVPGAFLATASGAPYIRYYWRVEAQGTCIAPQRTYAIHSSGYGFQPIFAPYTETPNTPYSRYIVTTDVTDTSTGSTTSFLHQWTMGVSPLPPTKVGALTINEVVPVPSHQIYDTRGISGLGVARYQAPQGAGANKTLPAHFVFVFSWEGTV